MSVKLILIYKFSESNFIYDLYKHVLFIVYYFLILNKTCKYLYKKGRTDY